MQVCPFRLNLKKKQAVLNKQLRKKLLLNFIKKNKILPKLNTLSAVVFKFNGSAMGVVVSEGPLI
jgi:hypothetical protein